MSAAAAVAEQRRDLLSRLGDLIYRMIVAAALTDQAAPTHTTMAVEARKLGLAVTDNAVRTAMADLLRSGRVALAGATCHAGYLIPGTDLRTQSSCQPAGYRGAGMERGALRSPTLEERAAMFVGQRYEDVPHSQGRVVSINPYLEAHGWASPLTGE
jgi:hypothetical protein